MHNLHVDGVRRPQLHTVEFDDDTPKVAVAATQGDRLAVMDLQSALALLPADQKEVLLLIALEEMSYGDVAKTLGIPIGTVMSRLSRGRERLRMLLDGTAAAPIEVARLKIVK